MNRDSFKAALADCRLVVVVRLPEPRHLDAVANTAAAAGIRLLEVSLTTPGARDWVAANTTTHAGMEVGLGTVCNRSDAREAVAAGAGFLLAPNLDPAVLEIAHAADTAVVPGAWTATEAASAANGGAAAVKLFPASSGGPAHLRALREPLPDIDFVAVGGVDESNIHEWFRAGAIGVGVGSSAVPDDLVAASDWDAIGRRLEQLRSVCANDAGRT